MEAGGYPGAAIGAAVQCVFAPYDIPNARIDGYDVVLGMLHSLSIKDKYHHSIFREFGLVIVDDVHNVATKHFVNCLQHTFFHKP